MIDRVLALLGSFVPGGGTGERTIKSAVWLIGQNASARILQLGTLVVLGRLIGPKELGLIGIALLALAGMREFTTIGLREALVQQEAEDIDDRLSTTWVLEAGRGLLLAGIAFLSAPFIATFFGEPRVTPVLRAVGLSPLLLGIKNPGVIYFQKKLDFHKQFGYQLSGSLIQFVVSIAYALVFPTVWAYVVGYLAGDAVRLVVSYVIHDYRPSVQFDREVAADLIGYGKWLTGSSILYFIYGQGDDAFLGWFLGPAALAFYQYAYRFSNAPATELSQVVSDVMFPAYSQLQNDLEQVRSAFFKSLRVTAFIAFPMAVGIAAVAPSFVRTFLGAQWVPMIPAMQVLAVYGLLRALGKTFSPVWKALNRPDYITKLSLFRVVLIAVFIFPATQMYGLVGTALVITGVYIIPIMPLDIYLVAKCIESPSYRIYAEFIYPGLAAGAMGLAVWLIRRWLAVAPPVEFVILVPTGVVGYLFAVALVETTLGWGIKGEVKTVLSGIKN